MFVLGLFLKVCTPAPVRSEDTEDSESMVEETLHVSNDEATRVEEMIRHIFCLVH
jgi:hypothetical protein